MDRGPPLLPFTELTMEKFKAFLAGWCVGMFLVFLYVMLWYYQT